MFCFPRDQFQSIHSTNVNRNKADIKWTGEWITFLDSLIQLNAFAENYNGVSTPKLIKKLTINTDLHNKEVDAINVKSYTKYLPARLSSLFGITRFVILSFTNFHKNLNVIFTNKYNFYKLYMKHNFEMIFQVWRR